jgi:hypothetical protein
MTLLYTPKSEDQLVKEGLFPKGDYDFKIITCVQDESKKGNQMLVVKMQVFSDETTKMITDYVVFGTNFGELKFRRLAASCGLVKEYEAKTLTANHFDGKTGRATINIQEASGDYPAKNVVGGYIDSTPLEDSIPFQ